MKKRHARTALVAAVILCGVFPGPSSARPPEHAPGPKGTTFDGSCALKGTVLFEPGATFVSQPLHYDFTGEGTCTGTLNGTEVEDVHVDAHQYGDAEGSCMSARTTAPGTGKITFPGGEALTYTLEFEYEFPETEFTLRGSRSGTARGVGTFRTDRTPPETTAKCATPDGSAEVPMDVSLRTETPMVSRKR